MTLSAHSDAPFDARGAALLADRGLEARVIAPGDHQAVRNWMHAIAAGFLDVRWSDEDQNRSIDNARERRVVGVYDPAGVQPEVPIGTVDSWVSELTLPGGDVLPSWAVSAVTVAPTHSGRGIARAMLEDQVRTAAACGLSMAMLTVSESGLYGRYGFAPAAFAADLEIDAWRTSWIGPEPAGRLDTISVQQWSERMPELFDRERRTRAGEVDVWPTAWASWAGLSRDDGAEAKKSRAVQYRDEAGAVRGLMLYRVTGGDEDFTAHRFEVQQLRADTPDAAAALWRFAIRHPLVRTVSAELRSVDEPVRWMVDDMRAVQQKVVEHQYLRVLDAPAVLQARGIGWDGVFVDPLGIAGPAEGDGPDVRDLASAYLGAPGTRRLPAELAAQLATSAVPYLSTWY